MRGHVLWTSLSILQGAIAVPATPTKAGEYALITPPPTSTLAIYARGIVSDLTSEAASYANSLVSELGSGIPSYVTEGLLPGLEGLPTGSAAASSAGVNSESLSASPTQVLNIPGYANWTQQGWNMLFHGNVYKQPNTSNETIDDLANKFLINTSVSKLNQTQQDQTRNVTREIYVVQQSNENVTMNLVPGPSAGSDGSPEGGGGVTATGGAQNLTLPYPTSPEGDFAVFVPLQNPDGGLQPGNGTGMPPQRMNVYAQGATLGNASSYLVAEEGLTIISDIDDILRVTKIYEPAQGILNTFSNPFTPWMNMPSIYANWSTSLPYMHFHYLTTTPEQITRNYMQYIYDTYPGGSFDTRPLNFSDVSATLSIRKYLLDRIFQSFPKRKFILVADTSNSDVMRDYPEMATQYPGQVQCIFLRNTTATDPGDKFPYDTSGFKNLSQNTYMFFLVPDDLVGLDIVGGQCWNKSIPQNVTFGYQGLPFGATTGSGNGTGSGNNGSGGGSGSSSAAYSVYRADGEWWSRVGTVLLALVVGVMVSVS